MSKRQIDARRGSARFFRHGMMPMMLHRARHDEQWAVRQCEFKFDGFIVAATDDEAARFAEIDGSDGWISTEFALVVGVKTHWIVAVSVEIAENGIEIERRKRLGLIFDGVFDV